jgi:hypothetical protein
MDYTEHIEDLSLPGSNIDNNVAVLNHFFKYKAELLPDDSILDALREYANDNGFNVIELAQELSEIPGFVDICKNDCQKFKYSIVTKTDNIGDDWE